MDAVGLQPVIDYLRLFHLPEFPSLIDDSHNKNNNEESRKSVQFDWIRSIAEIKRTIGMDIIFGFDIFPDPSNRTRNRIVIGAAEMDSVFPL